MAPRRCRSALLIISATSAGAFVGSCSTSPPVVAFPQHEFSYDALARELARANPVTRPDDAMARDEAGRRLADGPLLQHAMGEEVLWTGYDPDRGYDPAKYRATTFHPLVWTKMYLSTFMFTGTHRLIPDGERTILEMDASFRSGLDSGDYPYPFWHSKTKWDGYVRATSVALVFRGETLVAAFRKAPAEEAGAAPAAERSWDGHWRWTDDGGHEQPRVALFSYVLSARNPHAGNLDASYRRLEARARALDCTACHAPDNSAHASRLLLLNYPNQALAGRHTIVRALRANSMPPAAGEGAAPGIHDDGARTELLSLALEFERIADDALLYEDQARREGVRR